MDHPMSPPPRSIAERFSSLPRGSAWLLAGLVFSFFLAARALPAEKEKVQAVAANGQGRIMVVYPRDGSRIEASSTFLIGSAPPGGALTCQGQAVRLSKQGYFAHVVNLKAGANSFVLRLGDGTPEERTVVVNRDVPPRPLPPGKPAFRSEPVEPAANTGLSAGDLLPLSVRATPGGHVFVMLERRKVPLSSGRQPGVYHGLYKVRSDDHWLQVKPQFVLTVGKRRLSWTAPARLTVLEQPRLARTTHDDTIVRIGPGQARLTPLPSGVRLMVDGWQEKSMRCLLAAGRHVWILDEDLVFEEERGPQPTAAVKTVDVVAERGGNAVVVPLAQRLPFQVDQQLDPNCIILRIFGATSDTDRIKGAAPTPGNALVDEVTWKQPGDRLYELTVHLKPGRQWGYWADYNGSTLILHVKAPPALADVSKSLAGAVLCIDPGHGGSETGAMGPSGVKESTVNLAIALKLRDQLEAAGARVVMTRTGDESVSLSDRVAIASRAGADLLVSIHNNALPDGRDPWAEHGTSCYWYHPQAIELAQMLKKALISETSFPDNGTNYQNLALCRPSNLVAVLVEVAFMIHPDEYAQLITPEFQERAARALAAGIGEYLGLHTQVTKSPTVGSKEITHRPCVQ